MCTVMPCNAVAALSSHAGCQHAKDVRDTRMECQLPRPGQRFETVGHTHTHRAAPTVEISYQPHVTA